MADLIVFGNDYSKSLSSPQFSESEKNSYYANI
jgi:hypothetical protein